MNTTEKILLIEEEFKRLTGFFPYKFQEETILKVLNHESILLRAPTGSGKTETAIAPFLFANNLKKKNQILNKFPNKLIVRIQVRK